MFRWSENTAGIVSICRQVIVDLYAQDSAVKIQHLTHNIIRELGEPGGMGYYYSPCVMVIQRLDHAPESILPASAETDREAMLLQAEMMSNIKIARTEG